MKHTVSLIQYAPSIGSIDVAKNILKEIQEALNTGDVIIDFANIQTMGTNCSKLIFGTLYRELGPESFFERVEIPNASLNIRRTIRLGIEASLVS